MTRGELASSATYTHLKKPPSAANPTIVHFSLFVKILYGGATRVDSLFSSGASFSSRGLGVGTVRPSSAAPLWGGVGGDGGHDVGARGDTDRTDIRLA